jgi:hypothetical protein
MNRGNIAKSSMKQVASEFPGRGCVVTVCGMAGWDYFGGTIPETLLKSGQTQSNPVKPSQTKSNQIKPAK